MIKLLIFDFDGTLFHTAPGIHLAINALLRQRNLPQVDYDTSVSFIGAGFKGLAQRLNEKYVGINETVESLTEDFRSHYDNYYLQHSQIYDGVTAFLKSWPGDLAIVSNKGERYVKRLVEQSELKEFDWLKIVGGDTYAQKKPHPLPIEETLRETGHRPENTLIVGDGRPDIEVAKAVGLKSVAVDFGYTPIEDLRDLGADHEIAHFDELITLIDQIRQLSAKS